MNFETSDELRALQDSLSRLLDERHTTQHREAVAAGSAGYSQEIWKELAGLGVAALQVPEEQGGFGGAMTDLLPVMHEIGRSLVAVPFVSSCVLGAAALRSAADADARALLADLATGDLQLAWVGPDDQSGRNRISAVRHDDGWRLDGSAVHVPYAASADWLVVAASTVDGSGNGALFLVSPRETNVGLRPHRLIDGTPAADVQLGGVTGKPLQAAGDAQASEAVDSVVAAGIAAVCAEMVGLMEAAFRLTVDYLNTRQQFGRLIGQNQALRHRAAEMLVQLEMSRSMAIAAAVAAGSTGFGDPATRADLHRAKFIVGRNARSVCQQAIQLHGGIGMTEEYPVGHYLRRVHVLDHMFGDAGTHAKRLAQVL